MMASSWEAERAWKRVRELEAEVERLRAALRDIAKQDARWHHDHREDVRNPVNIARTALTEEKV
jgi:2-oxo-4-hydroxy-4-carboxy--5-ureidoimidazoline (OHCU) decarboxylase